MMTWNLTCETHMSASLPPLLHLLDAHRSPLAARHHANLNHHREASGPPQGRAHEQPHPPRLCYPMVGSPRHQSCVAPLMARPHVCCSWPCRLPLPVHPVRTTHRPHRPHRPRLQKEFEHDL
jgi:hypothetical protein